MLLPPKHGKASIEVFHSLPIHDVALDVALDEVCHVVAKKLIDVTSKNVNVAMFESNLLSCLKNVGMFLETSM